MSSGRRTARPARGFSYLLLLFAVAAMGLLLAGAAQVWRTGVQRERELELLFIGNQYREAIGRYFNAATGLRQYPQSLEELILDRRFPQPVRHLRRLFRDPLTGKPEWGLITEQGRIIGVHSLSPAAPLKRAHFAERDAEFADRSSYAEWRFVWRPQAQAVAPPPGTSQKAGGPLAPLPAVPAVPGRPTGEEQRQVQELIPDPALAACAAEHIATLRRCAALPQEDAQPCFLDAARRRNQCLAGLAAGAR